MVGYSHEEYDFKQFRNPTSPAQYTKIYSEMEAISRALKIAYHYGEKRINIRSPSKFCINAVTCYYAKWVERFGSGKIWFSIENYNKLGYWFTENGTRVKQQELIQLIRSLMGTFEEVSSV